MAPNQHRSTAGKTLVAFSLFAAVIAAFSVYLRVRASDEYLSFPTGLGDEDLYVNELGPGYDIFHPNLKFEGMPEKFGPGLYRRNHRPVSLEDEKMRQFAREQGDRHWVYVAPTKNGKGVRYFLKAGENGYVEFGEQKYVPDKGDTRPGVHLDSTSPSVPDVDSDSR